MAESTGLDPAIERTNRIEKKQIILEFIDSGLSVDPEDLMLQVPGLANHFRGIAEALERTTKSMPVVVHQQLGERLDKYETTLSERIDRHEAICLKPWKK